MTKRYYYLTCLSFMFLGLTFAVQPLPAQAPGKIVSGMVTESGTGLPLQQVFISVSSTGASTTTDEKGEFSISVPDLHSELIFDLPGYVKRNIFLRNREFISLSMVPIIYKSLDDSYNSPLGVRTLKDAVFPVTGLTVNDLKHTRASSFDQAFQGKVPGLSVTEQSGMPGQRTYMNIRGISSIYAASEPLLFIDGMIYDYSYATKSLMEGFALNPLDVVDIDDISDVTFLKDGLSFLGAAGSNGVIDVNTEQESEASTVIKLSAYGGISLSPERQDLLDATPFKGYFKDILSSQGYNPGQINTMYPWLDGNQSADEFYRYNNNTDWQEEIYKPSTLYKAHFFIKGGDDIATYNISTGYLSHEGIYDKSGYTRFNLRINGKINITDRFSITPNAKLSLADSKLANHGPMERKNPILASLMKSPLMTSYTKDELTGADLAYLDDVGAFNISNPTVIVQNAQGSNRNYHFLSSITAKYRINSNFNVSTLVGINFNNARENIFLPDIGIVQIDSAFNSPGDFVNEFRSMQNHTQLNYTNKTASGHSFILNGGFRYMKNSYKHNLSLDLNTASDDFKSLGDGSQYNFLRSTTGDNRGLTWISYFGNLNYNFRNKYFLLGNLSYDGNSATNKDNRYNFYPSLGAAWRLSAEGFLNEARWLDDFKLRGSWSVTGNMFSSVYDYSKLYYTTRRMNGTGVLLREIIPNNELELEKKNTINAGIDLSLFKQLFNIHVDYYNSNVNNLVIEQSIPETFGYTEYFDNGGKLQIKGLEVAADARLHFGNFTWLLGGAVNKQATEVKELTFLNPGTKNIVTPVNNAQFVTMAGKPINSYYGYRVEGLISSADAGKYTGPKGVLMQEGDIRFKDVDGNFVIDEKDMEIIGDPNPDLFGSAFTSLSFKNFELSALFNYTMGNDVYNYVRNRTEAMDSYANQSKTVLNRWTPSHKGTSVPRASYGDPAGNAVFSDRWIEDGSYMRLERLTLSYNFPTWQGVHKGMVVYLTATNLLTLTDYSGYDPEYVYVNSPYYMGIDYGKIPHTQSFVMGIKLNL